VAVAITVVISPTARLAAAALTDRFVTVMFAEAFCPPNVGKVGDALPPQVAVMTAVMTTKMKRTQLDFTLRAPPMTLLTKTPILPLAS